MESQSKASLIESLQLEPHVEGGYFRRTYTSSTETGSQRATMSSIYYLLTNDSPIGHFHQNRSDIVHYFHTGSPIEYFLLDANGKLSQQVLGPDPKLGHQFQLIVKGGIWKASRLLSGEFGLISEAVSPGFEYSDMTLATRAYFERHFPHIIAGYGQLIGNQQPPAESI